MLDDFQNLPTVSLMATGDIPPHLPGNPGLRYGYHYFLILLGVQFMRVAAAAPWTALDLARGLTLTLSIFLVGLLAWRLTRNRAVAVISALFYALASGARWLLLLLPGALLNRISSAVTLIGSGSDTAPDLVEGLARYWEVAGSGPIPFPFAFRQRRESRGYHGAPRIRRLGKLDPAVAAAPRRSAADLEGRHPFYDPAYIACPG
jgi:hypothetical protein